MKRGRGSKSTRPVHNSDSSDNEERDSRRVSRRISSSNNKKARKSGDGKKSNQQTSDSIENLDEPSTSTLSINIDLGEAKTMKFDIKMLTTTLDDWTKFKSMTEDVLEKVNTELGAPRQHDNQLGEDNGKLQCPICFENLDGSIPAGSTMCGHIFCLECIRKSITETKHCPTCQRRLRLSQVHPLYV